VAQRDAPGTQRIAHGLKSSSRYVGTARMAELSQALEEVVRDGTLERAPRLAAEQQRVFEHTRELLLGQRGA